MTPRTPSRLRLSVELLEDRLTPAADVIVDNLDPTRAAATGTWLASTAGTGYHATDFQTDGNTAKGAASFRFAPALSAAGTYDVFLRWPADAGLAAGVPVDVATAAGTVTRTVDQSRTGGQWVPLGTFALGATPAVTVRTAGTTAPVAADAARFVHRPNSKDRVFYAGSAGREWLNTVTQLSDGTLLAGGGADSLAWVPAGVPVVQLGGAGGITNPGGTGKVAFVARLSADLTRVLGVYHLPPGAAEEVRHVKLTTSPLASTSGAVYISGKTVASGGSARDGGYFIARLDADFLSAAPTALSWAANVWATGDHQSLQPWDVGGDGKVVYVTGQPFGADWAAVERLRADGTRDVVPEWRYQGGTLGGASSEGVYRNAAAAEAAGMAVTRSAIVLKNGRGQLRSWTPAEYAAVTPDGHGGTRQGTWPQDYYYSGPYDPADPTSTGPGYTGYRTGANPNQRVGGIAVDRRTGDFYIGFSTQSRLPGGEPDFEPAVIAMRPDGSLKWWSRLYTETAQNSSPDQYVDGLAVDYSQHPSASDLVVLARAHGNNVQNLWRGNSNAASNPRSPGTAFQNQFTGTNGDIHISWLGRLRQADGGVQASTYVAEYVDGGTSFGAAHPDPNLDGWPNPNGGWPNVNTTRLETAVNVDRDGRVYVVGAGRRTITTATAFQKMAKPGQGSSTWNDFVRVYAADLTTLVYSTTITGAWSTTTGGGGDNTDVKAAYPTGAGLVFVGWNKADDATNVAAGNLVPTTGVPGWGAGIPRGRDFLLGRLGIPSAGGIGGRTTTAPPAPAVKQTVTVPAPPAVSRPPVVAAPPAVVPARTQPPGVQVKVTADWRDAESPGAAPGLPRRPGRGRF